MYDTYMFVCLEFIVPIENFSLIWSSRHCRWRATNFDLCSALMTIEQWGFFNVPHRLRHGPTVYNGHLWGHVTLTPNAERLAMELSLPVLRLRSDATGDPTRMRGERSTFTPLMLPKLKIEFFDTFLYWN